MNNLVEMAKVGGLWSLWCFLHSLLIAPSVTGRFKAWLGKRFGLYRLFYNIFSLLALIPVALYGARVEQHLLFAWPGMFWQGMRFFLLAYGSVLFLAGLEVYDLKYFLGIRQWLDYRAGRNPSPMAFKLSGILKNVRHPWYAAGILLIWGMSPLTDVGLVVRLVLTAYFIIGAYLEERKLVRRFGASYRKYQERVPMLIPRFKPVRWSDLNPPYL